MHVKAWEKDTLKGGKTGTIQGTNGEEDDDDDDGQYNY